MKKMFAVLIVLITIPAFAADTTLTQTGAEVQTAVSSAQNLLGTLPSGGTPGLTLFSLTDAESATYGKWNLGGWTFPNVDGTRDNHVLSWGYNIGNDGSHVVTDQPAWRIIGAESHWDSGSDNNMFELHIGGYYPASSTTESRTFSMTRNKDTGVGDVSFRSDTYSFLDSTGTNQLKYSSLGSNATDGWKIETTSGAPMQFWYAKNNYANNRQLNAAGDTWLSLPFFNADNYIYQSNPLWIQTNRATAGTTFAGKAAVIQMIGTPTGGDTILHIVGPTMSDWLCAWHAEAATADEYYAELMNYNSSSSNANAKLRLFTNGANAGDPKIVYEIGGVTTWATGVDNSDGDAFKIGAHATLGSADKIVLPVAGGIKIITGTKGTCDASARGTIFYVAGGTDVADTLEVCRKDASNNYAWAGLF